MEDTDDQVTEVQQFQAKRGPGGRFLERPKGLEQHTITRENAAEMARRRWQKYQEAAADAVTAEIGSAIPNITTPEQAWGVMNARLAAQIMDSEKPRGGDLTDLGRNMGAIPSAHERNEIENRPSAGLDSETVQQLISILRDVIQPRDVIDVPASDITDTRNE